MAELYTLPDGWEWKELISLTDIFSDGDWIESKDQSEDGIRLIQTGNVGIGLFKDREDKSRYISKETFERLNCTEIFENDCLISRLPEPVGRSCLIPKMNSKMITSVDCTIIRFNKNILPKFFVYYSQLNYYFNMIMNNATGATRLRISKKNLSKIPVPIPPLKEQKRIVAKLDNLFAKIDKAIALHQKNIDEANVFMASVLNDVFVELEEKYEKIPLFDVADVNRGKSKHRPRNDKKLFGGNYPFIQTGDVRNANKYIDTFSETYSEFGLSQSKLWKKGTICMTIAANIGDVAILNIDSCFPDSVVGIYSENNSNDFLYYFLLTLKQQLESQATTTAQMNINLKILQTIGVPLPPLKTQQKVVSYLDEISNKMEKIKNHKKKKMQSLKALKASILDKAFKGEL